MWWNVRVGFLGDRFMAEGHANARACLPMEVPEAPETVRHRLVGRTRDTRADLANPRGIAGTATDREGAP